VEKIKRIILLVIISLILNGCAVCNKASMDYNKEECDRETAFWTILSLDCLGGVAEGVNRANENTYKNRSLDCYTYCQRNGNCYTQCQ
jgi:hypothetical protein